MSQGKTLQYITRFLFVITMLLAGLTAFGLYREDPGYNVLYTLASTLLSALGTILSWIKERDYTRKAQNNRRPIIRKVQNEIRDFRISSIFQVVLRELGRDDEDELFRLPWQLRLYHAHGRPHELVRPGADLLTIFDRVDRYLIINGEIGAGKTTTLYALADRLCQRAMEQDGEPIPVVLDLETWLRGKPSIEEWVVEQLWRKYGIDRETGKLWIENDELALLLDGLDSVVNEDFLGLKKGIEHFRRERGSARVVFCSLPDRKQRLPESWCKTLVIEPLSHEQVSGILGSLGPRGAEVQQAIDTSQEVRELATSPLFLSLICAAVVNHGVKFVITSSSVDELRRQVLADYVSTRLQNWFRNNDRQQHLIYRWLCYLAGSLVRHNESLFRLENLQTTWLQAEWQKRVYAALKGVGIGILIAIGVRFIAGLLITQFVLEPGATVNLARTLQGIFPLILYGLPLAAVTGILFGLTVSIAKVDAEFIGPFDAIDWSPDGIVGGLKVLSSKPYMTYSFSIGAIIGTVAGLVLGRQREDIVFGVLLGLILGPTVAVGFTVLLRRLFGREVGIRDAFRNSLAYTTTEGTGRPGEGIWQTTRNGLLRSLIVFFTVAGVSLTFRLAYLWLIYGWYMGPFVAILRSLRDGFFFAGLFEVLPLSSKLVCHYSLRAALAISRLTPWRFVQFLDSAVRYGILRKVGSGYAFVHPQLRELFASSEKGAQPL